MTKSKKSNKKKGESPSDGGSSTPKTASPVPAPVDEDWMTKITGLCRTYARREKMEKWKIPGAILLVSIVLTGNFGNAVTHLLYPIYWVCLRVIAVALGVALGLGFATHVYDQLEIWAGQKRISERDSTGSGGLRSSRKEETQALLMEHLRGSNTSGYSSANSLSAMSGKQFTKVAPSGGAHSKIDPGASNYVALMASAGYEVDTNWKRGQVVKEPLPPAYPFCDTPLAQQYAINVMAQEWPTLPEPIHKQLGRFMEFIMRDYVSTWYSMMDADQGIVYPDCVQRAKDKVACLERGDEWVEPPPKPPPKPHSFPRRMILSTASTRSLPLIEQIYRSMAVIFGNLAHRVQDVNAFRLVLLKWTKVIAHTFKVYRELRKALLEKQNVHKLALFEEARSGVGRAIMRRTVNTVKASVTKVNSSSNNNIEKIMTNAADPSMEDEDGLEGAEGQGAPKSTAPLQPVSEIALTREFLVTGKLHPACTFGLEIPSLLFADPDGKDCGTGVDNDDDEEEGDGPTKKKDEDQVLEERLFQTSLLSGCELDYNRVLASRIIKLLIPRQDYGSPIVASLLTEIMGGMVLTPVMSVFSPDYLNDWIKKGMEATPESGGGEGEGSNTATPGPSADSKVKRIPSTGSGEASIPPSLDSQQVMRSWAEDDENKVDNNDPGTPSRVRSFSDEDGDMILEECFDQEERQELGELMDLSSNEIGDMSALNKEAAEELLGSITGAAENESNRNESGDEVVDDSGDDEFQDDDHILEEATNAAGIYRMITLLDDALVNLQRYMDLEDCRQNNDGGGGVEVNWDDPRCKTAVLRLVLVVEALLFHGRRKKPVPIAVKRDKVDDTVGSEGDEQPDETVEEEFHSGNLIQILMDLTSDVDAFEKMHVKAEDTAVASAVQDASEEEDDETDESNQDYEPTMSDLSTLRTLIAAWLHTGQIYRAVSVLARAKTTVLRPFYHNRSFLRNSQTSNALIRQLKSLDDVDVMVDTVAILNSPKIDLEQEMQAMTEIEGSATLELDPNAESTTSDSGATSLKKRGLKGFLGKGMQNLNDKKKAIGDKVNKERIKGSLKGRSPEARSLSSENSMSGSQSQAPPGVQPRINRELSSSTPATPAPTHFSQMQPHISGGTPRYLEYHRNEAFASSLRSERDRRMQSWVTSIQNDTEIVQIVCRTKGATQEDIAYHRELHHVARIFYAGTNMIGIRDAARSSSASQRQRLNTADSVQSITSTSSLGSEGQSPEVSLLTVEMSCARRRIEVPDDDSSFLLRAQPRALNSMGVHRDTRNADLSYRSFAGSYEEPAVLPGSNRYSGGRFVRRCQLRYYPSNRTASVVVLNDARKLDQRKGKLIVPETPRGRQQAVSPGSVSFLSPEFMRERHLCQKCIPKGSTSRSQPGMLSSNVMEQADFTAAPRTGRALDFVYRMSLFESPMVDLGGKRFTVYDSAAQSAHRADASALEMSDAALSAALLVIGRDFSESVDSPADDGSVVSTRSHVRNKVELGPDGYPIIWMKYSRKQNDGTTSTEIKPYRTSFIRAAMLVTSTRQEAQLQCLIKCVKAGSAKSATKARTDAQLRPTLRLLDFARDRSREKQEKLMRDLKLGINHIDREQLRRNALVSPRYPTVIQHLQVSVESTMPAKDASVRIAGNPQGTVFKIRCIATIGLVDEDIPDEALGPYLTPDGKRAVTYKETWVIFRQFKDFQSLHKHLKSQVAASESSGTAGSRLVGAATAAFTAGASTQVNRSRHRGAMIPSLGQASKTGALGVTQRSAAKRMETLDGYLQHLLADGNPLSSSPELLMFIGAFYPLAPEVQVGKLPISALNDPLGRAEMSREVLKLAPSKPKSDEMRREWDVSEGAMPRQESGTEMPARTIDGNSSFDPYDEAQMENPKSEKIIMTIQAIVNKIDKVPLGQVRSRVFELLGYQFGFENASFFRSQMLSAVKTMSFAVTTPGEFRKTLYKTHVEQISAEALAYWIGYGTETLWPDGVFFESKDPLTPEQQKAAADKSRELLHASFPEQLRKVLGGDLTRDGLDILHEMLQNRMVMKSMFYMMFDLLWEEVFPEMKDILAGGDALDIDFDEE